MEKNTHNPVIDRAIALHKMLRLFTMAGGGEAYLNFMGNEFGHPEWIDFPREGNGWSFHYCRRQWSLNNNEKLKYQWLGDFDRDMVHTARAHSIFNQRMANQMVMKPTEQTVVFARCDLFFAFNFHSSNSLTGLRVPVYPDSRELSVVFSSDDHKYGGFCQVHHMTYPVKEDAEGRYIELYLPARTAIVLQEVKDAPKPKRTRKTKASAEGIVDKPKTTRKRATRKAAAEGEEPPKPARKPRTKKVQTEE